MGSPSRGAGPALPTVGLGLLNPFPGGWGSRGERPCAQSCGPQARHHPRLGLAGAGRFPTLVRERDGDRCVPEARVLRGPWPALCSSLDGRLVAARTAARAAPAASGPDAELLPPSRRLGVRLAHGAEQSWLRTTLPQEGAGQLGVDASARAGPGIWRGHTPANCFPDSGLVTAASAPLARLGLGSEGFYYFFPPSI